MDILLPDNLFPAVLFLSDSDPTKPTIITVMIYSTDQPITQYVAWFHEDMKMQPVTVYIDNGVWIEKRHQIETVNSRAIGVAIENYNPF